MFGGLGDTIQRVHGAQRHPVTGLEAGLLAKFPPGRDERSLTVAASRRHLDGGAHGVAVDRDETDAVVVIHGDDEYRRMLHGDDTVDAVVTGRSCDPILTHTDPGVLVLRLAVSCDPCHPSSVRRTCDLIRVTASA